MKIDVVCPLYQASGEIEGFIERLSAQENIQIVNAVFPITRSDDCEQVAAVLSEKGYRYFFVEEGEFSHSLTRERAIKEYCTEEVVVLFSQDVILWDTNAVSALASAISEQVVYAYGRQICPKKTIEKYVREKNYGEQSFTVGAEDIPALQLKAFFASDAFSAYHRPTFLALGGYGEHMMMSEDMFYAKKAIDGGYRKAYVAEAVVEHAHKLTIKQLYQRYFATGVWFAHHPEFDGYKTTDSGVKLALYVFKRAVCELNFPVLFRFLPDMLARYLGMKKGKSSVKKQRAKAEKQ